jgi:hypothetical protein
MTATALIMITYVQSPMRLIFTAIATTTVGIISIYFTALNNNEKTYIQQLITKILRK